MLVHWFGKATGSQARFVTALATLMRVLVMGCGFGQVAVQAGWLAAFTFQLQCDMCNVGAVAQDFVCRALDVCIYFGRNFTGNDTCGQRAQILRDDAGLQVMHPAHTGCCQ